MDALIIIALLVVVAGAILAIINGNSEKVTTLSHLIQDNDVTLEKVHNHIKEFKPTEVNGRKNGYTEKDIQKQLDTYLKGIYQHVTREHGVEAKNAKAIDLDIGNGKVGVEVKIARELFKSGTWDRAIGQIVKYTKKKYKDGNFILLVVGDDDDFRNSILSEVEDDVKEHKGVFCFAKIK